MKKRYFVSYQGHLKSNGNLITGSMAIEVENTSIYDIANFLASKNNLESATLLCLKDLSNKEYKMLTKENGRN